MTLAALYPLEELEVPLGAATLLGCTVTVTRLVVVVVTVDEGQVAVDSALRGPASEVELRGRGLTVTVTR